ncbi:MAG: hypothetical protein GY699_24270 [Desulfobacteraceae bacterium]|nr:hypothetical protein [Desulfobacteraceae bacterium]
MAKEIFKTCPNCGFQWKTRNDFLKDSLKELNGYTADSEKLEYGLFFSPALKSELFNHGIWGCVV